MTCPGPLADIGPTDIDAPRPRRSSAAATPAERLAGLEPMTTEAVMALAYRIARCADPLRAATNFSQRDIVAMAEALVTVEEALRRKLLHEEGPSFAEASDGKGD